MRVATAEQMRELDRIAIEERGIPSTELMERAARGVADGVLEWLAGRTNARVAVLCGPGNNGGDGVAAARFLLQAGVKVRAFLVGSRAKLTPDTAEMERRLEKAGGKLEEFDPAADWSGYDCFVDAIIGIGLHDPVRGAAQAGIQVLEQYADRKAVAVDIASGINADTGEDLGNRCTYVKTITFTLPKAGHFIGRGGVICGALSVVDIGIPAEVVDSMVYPITAVDRALVSSFLPRRDPGAHKGDFGKVHILGGSVGYSGAPVLAARGALRSGAGLVSLSVPSSIYSIVAVKCDEIMPSPLPAGSDGGLAEESLYPALQALAGKDACLIGPGLGRSPAAEALVCQILSTVQYPVVLDADGLNAVSAHIDRLDARQECPTILTPHDGEFRRLGGDLAGKGRLRAALDFAAEHGCVVVLKGHGTITALPNGKAFLNTTGNCGMAKGGSGDVLGGMILSLIGQGIHPVKAAVAAVWLHGRAGDLAAEEQGVHGMTPSDLVERIPAAIREVYQA